MNVPSAAPDGVRPASCFRAAENIRRRRLLPIVWQWRHIG